MMERSKVRVPVQGSSPRRSGGRSLFSGVNFLCWLLFRYSFQPYVTAVTRKRSRSFCQKCRWRVITKHTCFDWSVIVNWCMVEWCSQNLHRKGSSFTWHQPCNNEIALSIHHFARLILRIRAIKRIQSLIQNRTKHERSESVREQRIALYESGQWWMMTMTCFRHHILIKRK